MLLWMLLLLGLVRSLLDMLSDVLLVNLSRRQTRILHHEVST